MKQFLLISLLALSFGEVLSQDYLEAITKKSCSCLGEVSDDLDKEEFNMKLGVCIIEASIPYKKQLKKNHNIDLDHIETEGANLGRLIGVKMATVCPDALVKVTQTAKSKEAGGDVQEVSGTVTKIENDVFVIFHLKDDTGKISKYYWMSFVESDLDLTNTYSGMVGKALMIEYEPREFFDPKLLEYRQFSVIKTIMPLN